MAKRKVERPLLIESKWKVLFDQVEKSRLRRGKTIAKQDGVRGVVVRGQSVIATVKMGNGSGGKGYRVKIPAVDWWASYAEDVAVWLSRRPDWLGALYANAWNSEFLEFIAKAGLTLFPKPSTVESWATETHCTCPDCEPLCAHVVALVYFVIGEFQSNPLDSLKYVGLDGEKILERAKLLNSVFVKSVAVGAVVKEPMETDELSFADEKRSCLPQAENDSTSVLRHRIHPSIDTDEWNQWRKSHMAWK